MYAYFIVQIWWHARNETPSAFAHVNINRKKFSIRYVIINSYLKILEYSSQQSFGVTKSVWNLS